MNQPTPENWEGQIRKDWKNADVDLSDSWTENIANWWLNKLSQERKTLLEGIRLEIKKINSCEWEDGCLTKRDAIAIVQKHI